MAKTKQNGICAPRRLRSAWASAQSDQSLRCPHEECLGSELPTERTAQTDLSLRWAHVPFCWICHEVACSLWGLIPSVKFPSYFTSRTYNFCDFLFAYLHTCSLHKRVYPKMEQLLSFEADPFSEGRQSKSERVVDPESVFFL